MINKKGTKVARDLMYTIMSTVIMNVVLQIIIYPLITRIHGEEVTGDILYFIGIIYIVPQALGTALNNVRLISRKNHDVTNRDFVPFTVIFSCLSAIVCAWIGFIDQCNVVFSIFYAVFSIMYLLRTYVSVEFRLKIDFKGYFRYFCIICIGYLLGFAIYLVTGIWLLIFILGEAFALIYSYTKGEMLKNDGLSGNRTKLIKPLIAVFFSTIIRDCVNQFDRVILKQSISPVMVTQYHAMSLISKTILMLVQPVNSLILTYLTVKDSNLSKKQLVKFTAMALGCGVAFYLVSIAGTPIFVKLFYPNLYDDVIQYNFVVNLGVILGFVSTMFMSILLSQRKTTLQMMIQIIWGISYIIAANVFVEKYQIMGLALVAIITNSIKIIVSVAAMLYTPAKLSNQTNE